MKHENAHQYVDYIDGDGLQSLYSGANKYVTHKQYDTYFIRGYSSFYYVQCYLY